VRNFKKDNLEVYIYRNRQLMGDAAAKDISDCIKGVLANKSECNIIFAAAPSQNDVLGSLILNKDIDWSKINAYHMDEYIGLEESAPQRFGNFLKNAIFDKVPFKSINYIAYSDNTDDNIKRYQELLLKNTIDLVIMGIGENGHIAFNDPHVADFKDNKPIKVVELDNICRQQQVNDGCFASIELVPTHALTLTVPTLFNGGNLFCIVPAKNKDKAVYETINGSIDEHCPASILRLHKNAKLYLDDQSSALL